MLKRKYIQRFAVRFVTAEWRPSTAYSLQIPATEKRKCAEWHRFLNYRARSGGTMLKVIAPPLIQEVIKRYEYTIAFLSELNLKPLKAKTSLESRVAAWVMSRIGLRSMAPKERAMRLLEEALELAQAEGVPLDAVVAQMQHVYARASGTPEQEAGGVAVCLLAWCASHGLRLHDVAVAEVERIEAKPLDSIRGSLTRKHDADLITYAREEPADG